MMIEQFSHFFHSQFVSLPYHSDSLVHHHTEFMLENGSYGSFLYYENSNMRPFLIFSLLKYSFPRFGLYCNILLFDNNLLYFIITDVGFMHPKMLPIFVLRYTCITMTLISCENHYLLWYKVAKFPLLTYIPI